MKKIFIILGLTFSSVVFSAPLSELYCPNPEGGYVTLTKEPCKIPNIKNTYPYYAYSSDSNDKRNEGCYIIPLLGDDAPQGASAVVNIWNNGKVDIMMIEDFSLVKEVRKVNENFI